MESLDKSLAIENLHVARRHLKRVIAFLDWYNQQKDVTLIEVETLRESLKGIEETKEKIAKWVI